MDFLFVNLNKSLLTISFHNAIIKRLRNTKETAEMKLKTKLLLSSAAAVGSVYGICTLIDQLLFNRKVVVPEKLKKKVSDCDTSHLGNVLASNLQFVEDYGYEKHYICSDRGEKLTGYLLKSKEPSDIYAFGVHGYRSWGKKEFCGFAKYYLENGINLFFPDHIASGESEGTHCSFGYYEKEDCLKWLTYLTDNFGKDIKIFLHGISMGCATVCMMSERDELPSNVKFIIADCGFTTAKELFSFKLKELGISPKPIYTAANLTHKINCGYGFDDIAPEESVRRAKVPMLFVHGDDDKLVPSFMVHTLYENCGAEYKDLLLVPGADHAQSHKVWEKQYEEKINEFIEKFVNTEITENR